MSLGSSFEQREHVVHGALAVAAIVIEELDEGDVAVRIAERDLARRGKQRLRVLLDRDLMLLGFGRGLALLQFGHRLLQHFRMGEQIVVHDAFDLAALRGREIRRARTACGAAMASNAAQTAAIRRGLDVIGFVLAEVICCGVRRV